jgi:protein phosphatase
MQIISSASFTDRGLNEGRPINEDSLLEIPELGIFAVADGVGGAEAGEVASQMAVEMIGEAFANMADNSVPAETLLSATRRANSAIFQLSAEIPQLERMATTLAAVHVGDGQISIAHVGDSRVYCLSFDGTLSLETEDHSLVNDEIKAGRLSPEAAASHRAKNIINRALGAAQDVEVDLKTIPSDGVRALLLCTDGVTGHVSDKEISDILNSGLSPLEVCEKLKALCFERGARDNLSAVVVTFMRQAEKVALLDPDSNPHPDELLELEDEPPQAETFRNNGPKMRDVETSPQAEVSSPEADFLAAYHQENDEPRTTRTSYAKMIGLLMIGALVGAGAVILGTRNAPTPPIVPEIPQMASENIALTSFEKNRRNVDADPAAFLKELPPPADAEDHYLIGRAKLLTGDFAGAQEELQKARNGIDGIDPSNRQTLEKEISIGLSISETAAAQEKLKKELQAGKP